MTPSPPSDPWTVQTPGPSDRGLVARLLEAVVADDPSVAPAVAEGEVRPARWLQQQRPGWTGVVLDPDAAARTIIGYVAVVTDPAAGRRLHPVLVDPGWTGRGVEEALAAAAAAALAVRVDPTEAAAPVLDEDGLEIGAVTYPAQRVDRPRRRAALLGAGAIALSGILGVLAVQVGTGPLGSVLPFLGPGPTPPAAEADPTPVPSVPVPVTSVPVPGVTLTPAPTSPVGTGAVDPSGGPTTPPPTTPTSAPTAGPSPGPQPPGSASSLLDPVVATVVQSVDDLTGGALSPVTGGVQQTTDTTTDLLDETLETIVGLLPAPRR